MNRPIVCILSAGDRQETHRAIASARHFGLSVAVGDTAPTGHDTSPLDARRYEIEWRDDFAAARNQLATRVADDDVPGDYFLWLDSDEELAAFPQGDLRLSSPCLCVRIIDRADLMPRPILRLQRREPLELWRNAIHETLPIHGPEPPTVDDILIRHHGYDDPDGVAAKLRRNQSIVAREIAAGRDYFALALEQARSATGGAAIMAWLRAFHYPKSANGGYDPRHEPAAALCKFDYRKPALKLLGENPRILDLQLAVLASEHRTEGIVDEERLAVVLDLIAAGGGDRRYVFSRELDGAGRAGVLAWLAAESASSEGARTEP